MAKRLLEAYRDEKQHHIALIQHRRKRQKDFVGRVEEAGREKFHEVTGFEPDDEIVFLALFNNVFKPELAFEFEVFVSPHPKYVLKGIKGQIKPDDTIEVSFTTWSLWRESTVGFYHDHVATNDSIFKLLDAMYADEARTDT